MDSRTACSASALAERWRCGGSTSGRARALSRRCGTGRIGAAPTAGSELRAADDSRSLVSSGEIIGPIFPPTGGPAARRLQLAACFIFTCAHRRTGSLAARGSEPQPRGGHLPAYPKFGAKQRENVFRRPRHQKGRHPPRISWEISPHCRPRQAPFPAHKPPISTRQAVVRVPHHMGRKANNTNRLSSSNSGSTLVTETEQQRYLPLSQSCKIGKVTGAATETTAGRGSQSCRTAALKKKDHPPRG
jgi:hypothetical protein